MPQLDKATFSHQILVVGGLLALLFIIVAWVGASLTFYQIVTRGFINQEKGSSEDDTTSKSFFFISSFNELAGRTLKQFVSADQPNISFPLKNTSSSQVKVLLEVLAARRSNLLLLGLYKSALKRIF